ncbi:hypothetical protein GCM10023093_02480 [Nemorincola caseinilytica]|uniref:Uncharacterized protein n=1 Tax=Nemorincola caseinilytica TaxID=2054315 RepID=A0ABP8N630_9BACT
MERTIHKKLTAIPSLSTAAIHCTDNAFATIRLEKKILERLSADLLQPRPQAIAAILELAKKI